MFGTTTKRLFAAACAAALLVACGSAPVGPGFYRVERGDTLYKIARDNRTSVSNIVRWNQMTNPDAIEVGRCCASRRRPARPPHRRRRPPAPAVPASPPAPSAPVESAVKPASSIALIWPAAGNVVRTFDGSKSKGIDIANSPGTPVVAAAPVWWSMRVTGCAATAT